VSIAGEMKERTEAIQQILALQKRRLDLKEQELKLREKELELEIAKRQKQNE
jgi:hypothetical protein